MTTSSFGFTLELTDHEVSITVRCDYCVAVATFHFTLGPTSYENAEETCRVGACSWAAAHAWRCPSDSEAKG